MKFMRISQGSTLASHQVPFVCTCVHVCKSGCAIVCECVCVVVWRDILGLRMRARALCVCSNVSTIISLIDRPCVPAHDRLSGSARAGLCF